MIFKPMVVVKNGDKNIPRTYRPHYVWETIEECQARLNEELGKHEYRIIESPRTISEFDVWFIEDNLIKYRAIKKKMKIL